MLLLFLPHSPILFLQAPARAEYERKEFSAMSDTNLSTFPANRVEAIAYLYVQKKEFENPTPELLAEEYMNAYKKVHNYFKEHRARSNWTF